MNKEELKQKFLIECTNCEYQNHSNIYIPPIINKSSDELWRWIEVNILSELEKETERRKAAEKVINAYGKEYEDEILDSLKNWQSLIPKEEKQ